MYAYSTSTWDMEAGAEGYPCLHSEFKTSIGYRRPPPEKRGIRMDMIIYSCIPSTWQIETEGLHQVLGQPGLQSKIFFQKRQNQRNHKKKVRNWQRM